MFRAVLDAETSRLLVLWRHLAGQDDAVTGIVGVEDRRSKRVTAAVTLTDLRVESDPHTFQPAGSKTSGSVCSDRRPGVYSSTVPGATE